MENEATSSGAVANAVSLKLPDFWETAAAAWFAHIKAQFAIRNITVVETKYYYVVVALGTSTASRILGLLQDPPSVDKYDTIKRHLLQAFELAEVEQADWLFSLQGLGDSFAQLSDQQHGEQERSPSLAKEEQQEVWISPQEDQLPLQEVADTAETIFTPLCDGNDDGKDQPPPSEIYQTKTEGDTEPLAVTSFEVIQLDAKEDNFLKSEPTSDDHTLSDCCHVTKSETDHTSSRQNCEEAGSTQKARLEPHKMPYNKCKICGKVLYNLEIFKIHKTFHTGEKPFKCTSCGRDFTCKYNMERHTRTHAGKKPLRCTICGKIFTHKSHLLRHVRTHSGEKPFRCTTCGKMFTHKSNLHRHVRTHTGEKPFRCTTCGKMFTQKSNFQTHVRTHTGEKPFRCTTCGKMFTQKSSLQTHVRTHTGEKSFRCTTCGKMFTHNSQLQTHVRTHTGEKPFRCTTCGKMFSRKSHLQDHMRTHTGEKPFRCTTCGKMFTHKSNFETHVRTHTGEKPFKCTTCGKMFTQKSNLQVHIRTHTGEKPFRCTTCGKTFTRKPDLLRHGRTHTGEQPFRCTTCGKTFTRKPDLLRHGRTHIHGRSHSGDAIVEMGSAQNVISNDMS
ncbi:gastrula zinc finger protein XlCGF57.1-like [Lampris incognitus]|uniref:gastrula zinc finger protein XlCGF57.1-like n=1 Tax=Lampris incognitus TaxID=2546036 RepID=UPI0024B53311|nr:gastrula zinc finger protein XlCGF57.1-like [Lampris incognitus]